MPAIERGDQLLKSHDDGAVVRSDGAHDADRLVPADAQHHLAPHQVVDRHRVCFFVRHRLVEVDGLSAECQSHGDLGSFGHGPRLPRFTHDRVDQGFPRCLDVVEKDVENPGPICHRAIRPHAFVERRPSLGDRPPDFFDGGHPGLGKAGFVGRVLNFERLDTLNPATGDVGPSTVNYRHTHPDQNLVLPP